MMEKSSADPRFAQITENYKRIRENIAAAAEKSGRMPGDIRFMAVTKTVEPVYINHALSLGISLIGENKVQEYLGKREYLNLAHCEKHLIGHLQTNKVRQIVGEVDMIESVDSLRLAQEISRQSMKREITTPVLLEVNIGGEESKTGMAPAELEKPPAQSRKCRAFRFAVSWRYRPFVKKNRFCADFFLICVDSLLT